MNNQTIGLGMLFILFNLIVWLGSENIKYRSTSKVLKIVNTERSALTQPNGIGPFMGQAT